ncbi:MAG: amidase [Chloroflexi bacterium]|nr:amidase [Chloroflexota bacterium]
MTDATELWQFTLVEIGERIASGEVSPVEVTRACLARTGRLGPALNATTTILADQALEAARQAEREIVGGTHRGPLHGVPIGIKDLADVAGAPTTAGSHVFDGHIAERDSTLVRQLKRAGAVIIAKLNCDEMALHPTGAISQFGPGLNPWNTSRVSGGSSSGSGIAVAAGMMFAALGSDTGGSIRMPAAACGVVGIKPTYGRVSLDGVRQLAPTFDTPGPMARTTLDAALMLRAMVDPDDEARIGVSNSLTHLVPDADAGLDGLRLGVPSSYFFEEIDPEIERIARGAIDALARLGAELVAVELSSLPQVIESHWGIMILEAHASISAATGGDLSRVGEALRERLAAGLEVLNLDPRDTAATLGRLRAMRDDALADYRRATSQVNALVVPALPRSPVPIAQALTDFTWMGRFTRCFNCTHEPVVCLPCGRGSDGMPVGLQIVAPKYRERTAVRIALAYERGGDAPALGWPPEPDLPAN